MAAEPSPPLDDRELLEGQSLGAYRVVRKIGEGGFGRVYEATSLDGGNRVALKVGRSLRHEGRMEREARLAARLRSPHSVRVLGVERLANGSPLIVMELLAGVSLREYLAMRGRVEPALALRWGRQLAAALVEAHSIGLVHRDLKPSNLFLAETDAGPAVKLLDFGLARAQASAGEQSITGSDMVLGSPAYMSPEQIRSGDVTLQSDIWSFGVVFHEMLAGSRPFRAESNTGLLAAIAADAPEPLEQARPGLAPCVYELVERCLRKRQSERFTNAGELMEALDRALAAQTSAPDAAAETRTETLNLEPSPAKPSGRSRSVLVVALIAAAAGLLYRFGTETRAEAPPIAEPSGPAAGVPSAPAPPVPPAVVRELPARADAADGPSRPVSASSVVAPQPAPSSSAPPPRSREHSPARSPPGERARGDAPATQRHEPFFAAPDF